MRMSVSITPARDNKGNIFNLCRQEGVLYPDDMRRLAMLQVSDPQLNLSVPNFWDLRGHDFSVYDAQRYRFAATALPAFGRRTTVRRCFWIDSDLAFSMLRMMYGMARGSGTAEDDIVQIGFDGENLLSWLVAPTDLTQGFLA